MRRFGAIAERTPDLQNVAAEDFRLHVGIRPDRAEQLIVGDETPRVLDEILQHAERLGPQRDAGVPAPQALVRRVEAEGMEPHMGTSPNVPRTSSTTRNHRSDWETAAGREQYSYS